MRGGFSTRQREAMEMTSTDFDQNMQTLNYEQKLIAEVYGNGKK